jgi:HAD superfamily hydrolase (TIGR01509 family)
MLPQYKKVKTILFDLDGVLVDACELHRVALNKALVCVGEQEICMEDHVEIYNGLPTKEKIRIYGIHNAKSVDKIWRLKQHFTCKLIDEHIKYDLAKEKMLLKLKGRFNVGCCTNSIAMTAAKMLNKAGLRDHISLLLSNEDVIDCKPSPEMYWRAMIHFGTQPEETLIIEDSPKGYKAAVCSRARVIKVRGPKEVTLDLFEELL